jgi:hypothetical protein
VEIAAAARKAGTNQLAVPDLEHGPQVAQPFDRVIEFEAVLLVHRRQRQDFRQAPGHPAGVIEPAFERLVRIPHLAEHVVERRSQFGELLGHRRANLARQPFDLGQVEPVAGAAARRVECASLGFRQFGQAALVPFEAQLRFRSAATLQVGNNNGTGIFTGIISNGTGGALSVTKIGTGNMSWLGNNTYTGVTTIGSTGIVTVNTMAIGGTASGIGASSSDAANLVFNGTTGGLNYAGGLLNGADGVGEGDFATEVGLDFADADGCQEGAGEGFGVLDFGDGTGVDHEMDAVVDAPVEDVAGPVEAEAVKGGLGAGGGMGRPTPPGVAGAGLPGVAGAAVGVGGAVS